MNALRFHNKTFYSKATSTNPSTSDVITETKTHPTKVMKRFLLAIFITSATALHGLIASSAPQQQKTSREDNAFASVSRKYDQFRDSPFKNCSNLNDACLQFILRYTYDYRTPKVAMMFIQSENAIGRSPFSNSLPEFNKKIAEIIVTHPSATTGQIAEANKFVRRAEERAEENERKRQDKQNAAEQGAAANP